MLTIEESFGDFFRRLRRAKGFKSQKELANKSGISQTTISRIEDGSQIPKPETISALAKTLEVPAHDLLVISGQLGDEDILETKEELIIRYSKMQEESFKTKNLNKLNKKTPSNEKEFIHKLELSDEKLLEEFELTLDGKKLTEEEAKGVIAYLRSLRSMK